MRHQVGGLRGERSFKAVTEFAAGVDAFDDQTVVAIKVKSGPGKRKLKASGESLALRRPRLRIGLRGQASPNSSAKPSLLKVWLRVTGLAVRLLRGDDPRTARCVRPRVSPHPPYLMLFGQSEFDTGDSAIGGGRQELLRRRFLAESCSEFFAPAPRARAKLCFSGVGKTAAELEFALRSGILLFNAESAVGI